MSLDLREEIRARDRNLGIVGMWVVFKTTDLDNIA